MELLSNPLFINANLEFLEALEDYRKNDYRDSLTKSASAFESVMKVICNEKGWSYNETDTASKLLSILIANIPLDSFFESPLILISTIRNKLSKSHGAGTQVKVVDDHLVRYVLNATASAILLLVEASDM